MILQRFLALVLASSPVWAVAESVCSPPALGHPCAMEGIAAQGNIVPEPSLALGNPVHLATGNKHQRELDLPANPAAPLLQVLRHYNSLDPRQGPFGRGWTSSYDTRLYPGKNRVQIVQADGSRITFHVADATPLQNPRGFLKRDGAQWQWFWPDGRHLRFDDGGRLIRIVVPRKGAANRQAGVEIADIVRHDGGVLHGAISHIISSSRTNTPVKYQFHYRISGGQAYVSAIDTPLGRFSYRYETIAGTTRPPQLRLTAVRRPDGLERRYLYDAHLQAGMPHLLTGVALVRPATTHAPEHKVRTNSWAYDSEARAIKATQHHPVKNAYSLRIGYERKATAKQAGLTVVNQADGRQTRITFQQQGSRYVLADVSGASCAGCPAPGTYAPTSHGRIRNVHRNTIAYTPDGRLASMRPFAPGWPGLHLEFDAQGRRTSWQAKATGRETATFDAAGQLQLRQFQNGDGWRYDYDRQGRPRRIVMQGKDLKHTTRLGWNHDQLISVRHPHESEKRLYDSLGRLIERRVSRNLKPRRTPLPFADAVAKAPGGRHPTRFTQQPGVYTDRFDYDSHHRPVRHQLPEGGALHYQWSATGRLVQIEWQDASGQRHTVIQASDSLPGYRYGNGMTMSVAFHKGHASALSLSHRDNLIWQQFRSYDYLRRPVRESTYWSAMNLQSHWHYLYDKSSRLSIAAESHSTSPPGMAPPSPDKLQRHWFAWHSDGSSAAVRRQGSTRRPHVLRDASGLPTMVGDLSLRYGPMRRLEQVWRGNQPMVLYRHNAFGHRIERLTPQDHTHYLYLDNRLVAEARRHRSSKQPSPYKPASQSTPITRRYIHAGHVLVGMIDYTTDPSNGKLYAVHSDLMGAPVMLTDDKRNIRWQATYTPLGSAHQTAGDLNFDLRLPGQIFDDATGWHDNLLRTFHPQFGQYLEPDPLGPLPGSQAWGYAAQQPRRFVDPLGLLLFAFDGTRMNAHTRGNVWLFSQRYLDGPVFYHSGPGNPYYWDLDAVAAHEAPQTIQTQWQHLLNALHEAPLSALEPVPIDIIGYSRGAALARHFGNLIEQHVDQGLFSFADPLRGQVTACVDLRFMGLFDTVAQFGLGGALNAQYDFSIASAWSWVAHAVALHERRSLFPLLAATGKGYINLNEVPFIGAHADVGGGTPPGVADAAAGSGDLSDIALNWMVWQARAAAVPLDRLASEQSRITNPVLHDERSSLARTLIDGDRRVDDATGRLMHGRQDDHARFGRTQREATEALIKRYEDWHGSGSNQVGEVDLDAYARWLHDELGWHAAPLQDTPTENHAII